MYNSNYGYPVLRDVKSVCNKYMNFYVLGQMLDGSQVEGIITSMDDDGVIMLVPEEIEAEEHDNRYGGYGGYGGHGGRRRHRRFRRRRYPYAQFVFPFILPYPFYY